MRHSPQLIDYLKMQTDVINRLLPAVSRTLKQTDIHQLRVGIRRARTALWLLKNSSAQVHIKSLDSELRKLTNALGKVRDLDVAILDAKKFGVEIDRLRTERKAAQKKLRNLVTSKCRIRMRKKLNAAINAAKAADTIVLKNAREKLKVKLNKELGKNLKKQKSLHHIRLTLKKARYALEALQKPVDQLKRVQTALGTAHDLEKLQVLTKKNRRVQEKWSALNNKAIPLVKPALRYALRQF